MSAVLMRVSLTLALGATVSPAWPFPAEANKERHLSKNKRGGGTNLIGVERAND